MRKLASIITNGVRELRAVAAGPYRVARLIRRGPVSWLILCGGLLVAAIAIGTALVAAEFREQTLANGERELENTALLVSRHFDEKFQDCNAFAGELIAALHVSEIASAEEFRSRISGNEARQLLVSKMKVMPYVGEVNLFDAEGEFTNSSSDEPILGGIAERSYFKAFKTDANSGDVIVEAARSLRTGRWGAVFARRLTGANGVFLGVLERWVNPAVYERFFASVALGEGAAISMFHRDGTRLARHPHVDSMIGQKPASLQSPIQIGGKHRTLRMQSPVDHQQRLAAISELNHFPVVIIVSKTVASALAAWQAQTRLMIVAAGLLTVVIVVVLFLIVRQLIRQHRESQERLEQEKQRLDTALNNMTQGLILYDSSAHIVVCNQRYIDMYGLSADIVKPGAFFRDIVQYRKETGSFKGDVDEFCSRVLNNVAGGKVTHSVLESADGRAVLIINRPLPQGGWVATMEDITERRNLEQERDRNYRFLLEIIDHIPSQITVKDVRDHRYLLVNRVAEDRFGLSREQIVGKTADDVFPKTSADIINADDERALQSETGLFLDEHEWETQAQGRQFITSRRIAIRDEAGEARYIINVVDDVTDRRRANEKIAHLAHYDALTDLPNRVLFRERVNGELARARRGDQFALLYIDIDEFKGINDSLGHHVGDELLKLVATRLKNCSRETDVVARLGGDEFAVVQTGVEHLSDVVEFVTRIHDAIREPYHCLGHQLSTDASIGIAIAPQDGNDLEELIKNADLAMYGAKADGRRTYRFFEPAMEARARARLAMQQDLRPALANSGFEIHYQPFVALREGRVTGCEALLRWRHPERGMISPAEFIPVAEDSGMIVELGEWVLRTACTEAAGWPQDVRLAVNVSPVQLKTRTFPLHVAGALAASGLPANRLEIEITEAVLIRDDETALSILHHLREMGVRIALDDFGTGYSSLSYLKRFPFDKIKIDRSFVSDIVEVDSSAAIVQAVVNIAAARRMTTTAEGVETAAQRDRLRALGCTEMQGYLFSAAKPGAEVRKLLDRRSPPRSSAAAS